jgi:hypothetical protein
MYSTVKADIRLVASKEVAPDPYMMSGMPFAISWMAFSLASANAFFMMIG